MDIIQKVKETIQKYSMINRGERILVGLSGGPDSVCLLTILYELMGDFKIEIHASYIDHGLRDDETPREINFCKDLCARLNIPFHTRRVEVKEHVRLHGGNIQEVARDLRYSALAEIAENIKAQKIALGHNADDLTETVIMNLIRGSGMKGLTGIPPVRGMIIRPLIEVERREIEAYLNERGQSFLMDSSNLKDEYTRNYLRRNIIPHMKEINPSLINDICRMAEILRDEEAYLDLKTTKTLMRLISRKSDDTIELFLSPLETVETPILRRVLRRAVDAVKGLRGISFANIEDIIQLIKKGESGDRIYLPHGIRAIREYSILKITSRPVQRLGTYTLNPPGTVLLKESGHIIEARIEPAIEKRPSGKNEIILDADRMTFPLVIRARKDGDYFYPLGFGKRKKIHDFFIDEKVPRDERDTVPIVVSGDDIVWVAGYRGDERYKVTEKTERYLRLIIKSL
jgi:tRNA(Ile)-lysidine synthase